MMSLLLNLETPLPLQVLCRHDSHSLRRSLVSFPFLAWYFVVDFAMKMECDEDGVIPMDEVLKKR